jgi:3-hydroxyisobutyrate dehydrogenase-like beta-hydroxyacid dehydrogenase
VEKVGFIGVGMMGGEIAARLVESGVPVLAYDNNPQTLSRMAARGLEAADSVLEVADSVEVVFSCLPNAGICRAVALGPGGVAEGRKVKIYVETSTVGRSAMATLAADMAKFGITVVDSPVVGGVPALKAGTLGVLAGGPQAAFEQIRPLLEAYAGRVFYLGEEAGIGQAGKVINNSVAYASLLATCEAVVLGMKAGVSLDDAVAIINQGSGANFFSERVFPMTVQKGVFDGTGAIEIGVKDVECFLEEAISLGMETPVAASISRIQKRIKEAGEPGRDTMTIFNYFEELAHLR